MSSIICVLLADIHNNQKDLSNENIIPAGTELKFDEEVPANVERLVHIGVAKYKEDNEASEGDHGAGSSDSPGSSEESSEPDSDAADDQSQEQGAPEPEQDPSIDFDVAILGMNAKDTIRYISDNDMTKEQLESLLKQEQSNNQRKTVIDEIQSEIQDLDE